LPAARLVMGCGTSKAAKIWAKNARLNELDAASLTASELVPGVLHHTSKPAVITTSRPLDTLGPAVPSTQLKVDNRTVATVSASVMNGFDKSGCPTESTTFRLRGKEGAVLALMRKQEEGQLAHANGGKAAVRGESVSTTVVYCSKPPRKDQSPAIFDGSMDGANRHALYTCAQFTTEVRPVDWGGPQNMAVRLIGADGVSFGREPDILIRGTQHKGTNGEVLGLGEWIAELPNLPEAELPVLPEGAPAVEAQPVRCGIVSKEMDKFAAAPGVDPSLLLLGVLALLACAKQAPQAGGASTGRPTKGMD